MGAEEEKVRKGEGKVEREEVNGRRERREGREEREERGEGKVERKEVNGGRGEGGGEGRV